jgi:hypothetical protein
VIENTAPTAKAVTLVLVPALVLMLAFAFFYVGAFHEPTPHHVPLAVVGPPAVAAQLNRLPGEPLDARQASSRSDALSQIDDRKVYGAYDAATNGLFVASAANRATAVELEETFNIVAAAQGRPAVRVTDVKPLPRTDPNGTAAFYAVIAWMFGGYIGSTLIGLMLSAEDYDAALAERYGWINRALPAHSLDDFLSSLAYRIAAFPAAGHAVVKERVNAIALAPVEEFRRDSDLFGEGVGTPEAQQRIGAALKHGFQTRDGEMEWARKLDHLSDR